MEMNLSRYIFLSIVLLMIIGAILSIKYILIVFSVKSIGNKVCGCISSEYNAFLKLNKEVSIFNIPLYLIALVGFSIGIILGILALYDIRYTGLAITISSLVFIFLIDSIPDIHRI